ncbi:uncharacterized protein [Salvelinus alpinus]|uniref:uncharacterized protein isoform X2 n=1 Tax=Salvelinus alpinus TaxID=8036 RepID=UPI0039FCDF5D
MQPGRAHKGLSCVTECVKLGRDSEAVYLCEVCVCRLSKADVRSHIMGSLHRYRYIKVDHPHFVSEWKPSPDLFMLARPLMEMAQILEKREGTGDVQVLELNAAIYEEMTLHSDIDALILLHAIRTGREQRNLQSQSEKPSVQSEYLAIQSQRTIISPQRLYVQPEKPVVQIDNRTVLLKSPTARSWNSSGQSEKSPILRQSVSVQSQHSSGKEERFSHETKPLIGASLKRPVSALPWQHDPSLSPTPDYGTDGGQTSLGGSEGAGLQGVPSKVIRCEPVFKVILSMTDGPLLLERNSFSLETSLSHSLPLHSPP